MNFNNLQEMCLHLGISKDVLIQTFSLLKEQGLIFTPALNASEFVSNDYPVRLAVIGPTADDKHELSTGPFAISRHFYETYFLGVQAKLKDAEVLSVLSTFMRVEYEKFGVRSSRSKGNFSIVAEDDSFYSVAQMSGIYDLSQPYVYTDYVWFDVTEEFRENGQAEMSEEETIAGEYWWWNTKIAFDEGFDPSVPKPEDYILIPDWFYELPKRYLPEITQHLLLRLFSHLTLGLRSDNLIISRRELAEIIELLLEEYAEHDHGTENIDRELLVKELCDYNGHVYPVDIDTYISYLQSTSFILPTENESVYKVAEDWTASSVFSIPPKWEEKYIKFVETGSVLFGYLSIDEIVA